MKNLSLKYKLFLSTAVVVILYAVSSILFVNLYIKNTFQKESIRDGKALVAAMSLHIIDDLLTKDFVAIGKFFDQIMATNSEVSYIFIEKDGEVLLHTFQGGFPRKLLDVVHERNTVDYVIVKTAEETYHDFSAPIFEGRAGFLRVGISEKMGEDAIRKTIQSLLIIALVCVIIALGVSILISRKLTKPISLLTSTATEIADGNYSKVIEVHGDDEVEKLSGAFNKMAGAVKIREKELREVNEELEAVNIRLHEYIEELNRAKDELVKSKQDRAVTETSKAMIHHMRQPLTYLVMAIELFTDEIQGGAFNMDTIQKRLFAIEEAGMKVSELLKKFEALKEYKTVEYSDRTKIIDIGEE
ncbi:MAG: response regulator with CheY-like receiver AAA-type ATPase and DNA-binding domain [Nitrospirae bacterium]|nr:MAG: response regulator with CheY-like receiver AAA-type ATPase and DNA-binding domain [Nitrospirota bacterium]